MSSSARRAPRSLAARMFAAVAVVAVFATLAACGSDSDSSTEARACPPPGAAPVTLDELVTAFRDNGVSLEPNRLSCELKIVGHASNMGPDGVGSEPAVVEEQGRVLCFLGKSGTSRAVSAEKYPGDVETGVSALNVLCTVYPSSRHLEATQVGRVKAAMRQLVREAP